MSAGGGRRRRLAWDDLVVIGVAVALVVAFTAGGAVAGAAMVTAAALLVVGAAASFASSGRQQWQAFRRRGHDGAATTGFTWLTGTWGGRLTYLGVTAGLFVAARAEGTSLLGSAAIAALGLPGLLLLRFRVMDPLPGNADGAVESTADVARDGDPPEALISEGIERLRPFLEHGPVDGAGSRWSDLELAVLLGDAEPLLPPGAPVDLGAGTAEVVARRHLERRGAIEPGGAPVASVQALKAAITTAGVAVRREVRTTDDRRALALYDGGKEVLAIDWHASTARGAGVSTVRPFETADATAWRDALPSVGGGRSASAPPVALPPMTTVGAAIDGILGGEIHEGAALRADLPVRPVWWILEACRSGNREGLGAVAGITRTWLVLVTTGGAELRPVHAAELEEAVGRLTSGTPFQPALPAR